MIQIGRFRRTEAGYAGTLKTLSLEAELRISPVHRTNDKAPDHRVFIGALECGAAWSTSDDSSAAVLSLKLEDPALSEPIHARLLRGKDQDFVLVWARRTD